MYIIDRDRIAKNISDCRNHLGLSQEQFAEKMEVSRQAISSWEKGIYVPQIDKITKMANLCGIDPRDILIFKEGAENEIKKSRRL